MESGAMLVMRYAGFFDHLRGADLVITGQGRVDLQTAGGKLCSVVARESRRAGIPVALLAGAFGEGGAEQADFDALRSAFDYAVSICNGEIGLDAMLRNGERNLKLAAENLIRAIQIGKKLNGKRINKV